MPWSRVNTEYSINRVQHTPSKAYTEYCIHNILHHPKIDCLPPPASLSAFSGPCCTQFSTFPELLVNQWIESHLPLHMPPDLPPPDSLPPDWPPSDQSPPDWLPPSTCPILIDHGLQVNLWAHSISASVHLQTRSITASECMSQFIRSRPPSASSEFTPSRSPSSSLSSQSRSRSASPNSLDHGLRVHLWVHLISVSKWISEFTRCWSPSASPNLLDHSLPVHLWVHLISASKCISEFTRFLGLQVHLQTPSIPASKCISEFTRCWSASASPKSLDPGLYVHRQGATVGIRWYSGNGGGQSDGEYILGRPWSRQTSSHFHLIISYNENTHSIFPNFWSQSLCPRFHGSTQLRGPSTPGSIISSHPIPMLFQPELLFLMISIWMSRECGGVLMVGSLPSSSIVSPQRSPSGASLNGRVQVLLQLCSTTICDQIDCMYIYRKT